MSNIHERTVPRSLEEVGALLDSLASRDDRLWPHGRWPAMRLDGGLRVGAHGGHGPIRYRVVGHEPGRRVRFRAERMPGVEGEHGFEVLPAGPGASVIRHVVDGEVRGFARMYWSLVIRRLHDALIEDALDRAEGLPQRPLSRSNRLLLGVTDVLVKYAAARRRHAQPHARAA